MPHRHSQRAHSSNISDNNGILPLSFDVVFILSNLGVKYSIYGSKEDFDSTRIYGVKDIKSASSEDLSFCSLDDADKAIVTISKSNAKVIICHQSLESLVYPRSGKQQVFDICKVNL